MTILGRLSRWIDAKTPERVRSGDPRELRRARLVLWIVVVLETQTALFAALFVALRAPMVAWLVVTVGLFLAIVPSVLRRSTTAAMHYEASLLLVILDGFAWYTGGLHAPALFWSAIVPVMATLVSGRRAGGAWLGVVCANVTAIAALTLSGHPGQTVLAPWAQDALVATAAAMLACVTLAFALVYESTGDALMGTVDEANQDMRRVLDNVEQGFLTIDARGRASAARSAILTTWFGDAPSDAESPLWAWLACGDVGFATFMDVGWDQVFEGVVPPDIALDQLPRRIESAGRTFGLTYKALLTAEGSVHHVVVVVSDLTAELAADRAERAQREQAALLERLSRDRRGFLQFWDEAEAILHALHAGSAQALRLIHTLKGNAGVFGLESVMHTCHEVESRLAEEFRAPEPADVAEIERAWRLATSRVATLLLAEKNRLEIQREDYAALELALLQRVDYPTLSAMVSSWRFERTADTFARVKEQAQALADRLGKGPLEVQVTDNGVRLDPARWASVWSAMVHAVRNAIDHGIEDPSVRAAHGKSPAPMMRLASVQTGDEVVVEISDDGSGVDWDRVRDKATRLALPHRSQEELTQALFSDGFSTRETVTELSGRGVGLAALAASARDLGASITLDSISGYGTTIRIVGPRAAPGVSAAG